MGTVAANGITLAYEDEGPEQASTDPLLLIHGHPFDRTMWAPQLAAFRDGRRVIAPDLRGLGESSAPPGTPPWDFYARDLSALLDHLGIQTTVIAGLSMGGQIALEFYRLFPDRVRGLVIADSFATLDAPERKRGRYDLADRLIREGMDGYATEILPKMITPHTIETQPAVAEHVLAMMRHAPAEGAAAALRSRAERPDYTGLLPAVAVPALLVTGRDDAYGGVDDIAFMRQRIPDATSVVIEDAGHLPNLEHPADFNEALATYLTRLAARP